MQINVAQLLKDSIGATRAYTYTGSTEIDGQQVNVDLHAEITHIDSGVLVSADVKTDLPLTCVRCLEEFPCRLEFSMVEEYCQTVPVDPETPIGEPCQPEHFTINEKHVIDLAEAVRQNAVLALPMQPLCDPDCRGICPQCGCNLNRDDCDCRTPQVDPRLAPLLELKLDDESEG